MYSNIAQTTEIADNGYVIDAVSCGFLRYNVIISKMDTASGILKTDANRLEDHLYETDW